MRSRAWLSKVTDDLYLFLAFAAHVPQQIYVHENGSSEVVESLDRSVQQMKVGIDSTLKKRRLEQGSLV